MELNEAQNDDVWAGGFYELAIPLGADETLFAKLDQALWNDPSLDGPFLRDRITNQFVPVPIELEPSFPRFGTVKVVDDESCVCQSSTVRLSENNDCAWWAFGIPLGVYQAFDGRVGPYPFGNNDSLVWRSRLNDRLAEIGQQLFAAVGFDRAIIGFEVVGELELFEKMDQADSQFAFLRIESGSLAYLQAGQ